MKRDSSGHVNRLSFDPGTTWIFDGQIVEIDGIESTSTVSVRIQATGDIQRVPVASLIPMPSSSPKRDAHAITTEEWSRIVAIANDIRPLLAYARVPRELLIRVASAHNFSTRHVQRLLRKFRPNPQVSILAKGRVGRPRSLRLLHSSVEEVIGHVIRKHYLRRESVSRQDIVERARSVCRRCGLPVPSRGAILRRIAQCKSYEDDLRRLGSKRARQHWEARPGVRVVERPLDVVQIDHTLVDLMVLSEDRRDVLGRPWLTVAIDLSTRVVLGFYLSMDPPSAVAVGLCIAHAVLPKPDDARDPGLWPMYGKMLVIHVDNGKDLISAAIRRGCEEHGIALETRPIGKPHYGGHIERLMGSLMRMVHGLPGTTFSNVRERGDYDSERKATMTLLELHAWMLQKIGRSYHTRSHRALGVPPLIAWERAWRSDAGEMSLPPLVSRPKDFRLDFLPFQQRRLQRTGIQLWQSRYWSEPLRNLVSPGYSVQVHYHPHELGRVWVRTHDDRVIEAFAVAGPAAGRARQRAPVLEEAKAIEAARDKGFEACDRIESMAASAVRAQRRLESRKTLKDGVGRHIKNKVAASFSTPIDVPLDRSSVRVKRVI